MSLNNQQQITFTPAVAPAMRLGDRAQWLMLHGMLALPASVKRRIAGPAITSGPAPLALDAHVLVATTERTGYSLVVNDSAPASRAALRAGANALRGAKLPVTAASTTIPSGPDGIEARLYTPSIEHTPGALLLFLHGGGWVVGDLHVYATDLAGSSPSRQQFDTGFMLTEHDINWFYDAYTATTPRTNPRLSPSRATPHAALPPPTSPPPDTTRYATRASPTPHRSPTTASKSSTPDSTSSSTTTSASSDSAPYSNKQASTPHTLFGNACKSPDHRRINKNEQPPPGHGYRLRVGRGPVTVEFNGMLDGLRKWARAAGLLRGQRNRRIEQLLAKLRNSVAHPSSTHLLTPVDCAVTLRDLAEFINQLWGVPTPGGRLYPAPAERTVLFMGWNANGSMTLAPADHLTADLVPLDDIEQCAIVRAFFSPETRREDPDLHYFNSRYENTRLPTEYLWGPGSPTEAATWLATAHPTWDSVDLLDQVFAIRHDGDRVYRPMKPGVLALLDPGDQTGHWYLVQADFPQDAFVHIRQLLAAEPGCSQRGECEVCPVEILDQGTVTELVGRGHLAPTRTALPPAFCLRDDIPSWRPAPLVDVQAAAVPTRSTDSPAEDR